MTPHLNLHSLSKSGRKILNRPWIFLPVEVKAREFVSKMFFASIAADAGFGIIIGRNGMNISSTPFPRGIYFDKCLSSHKVAFHEHQVKTLGNLLVSFDEEGLLFRSEGEYLDRRTSKQSIDLSSVVFLWGNEQKRIISKRYKCDEKLEITGGPRVDIWKSTSAPLYQAEVDQLLEEHGQFILVVSNWGFLYREKAAGLDPSQIYQDNPRSFIRSRFIKLISTLAEEFTNQTIIVRPHPSDLPDFWRSQRGKFAKNVKIIDEGSISPWIRAANLVIHNNCTTGIEAWVGKIPVIAYSPINQAGQEFHTYTMKINHLGVVCCREAEVIDKVRASISAYQAGISLRTNANCENFLCIDRQELASQKILRRLKALDVKPDEYLLPRYGILKKLRASIETLKWKSRDLLGLSGLHTLQYRNQKNPGMALSEIKETLSCLSQITKIPAEFFDITQIGKDTFCIAGPTDATVNTGHSPEGN